MNETFEHSDLIDISTNTISELSEDKLPTKSDVLKLLFHKTKTNDANTNVDQCCKLIIKDVKEIWDKIPIPSITLKSGTRKLKKLYVEFRSFQKYRTMNDNKISFINNLSNVVDILPDSTLSLILRRNVLFLSYE